MTPLWSSAIRATSRGKFADSLLVRALASCRCFDFEPVAELANNLGRELASQAFDIAQKSSGEIIMDCGVDVAVPHTSVWIEGFGTYCRGATWAMWLVAVDDLYVLHRCSVSGGKFGMKEICTIELAGDGLFRAKLLEQDEVVALARESEKQYFSDSNSKAFFDLCAAHTVGDFFSALAILSSPRLGVSPVKASLSAESALGKFGLRKASRDVCHSRVFIRIGAQNFGVEDIGRSHSPKAYHFVRSHLRRKEGRVETVRSHWRGDPAFGIRVPHYKVSA